MRRAALRRLTLFAMGAALFKGLGLGIEAPAKRALNLKPALQRRRWHSNAERGARSIVVQQSNVLADGFFSCVGEHADSTYNGFHKWSTVADREWDSRFPRFLAELDGITPDVVCLQEVQWETFEGSFRPALEERGYAAFLGMPEGAEGYKRERDLYTVLAVRRDAFNVIDQEVFVLAREAELFADAHRSQAVQAAKKKPRAMRKKAAGGGGPVNAKWLKTMKVKAGRTTAFAMLLRHRETQQLLSVCTTHLYWDPRRPDIKSSQAGMLCYGLRRRLEVWASGHGLASSDDLPLIVAGDFNAQPRNAIVGGGADGPYQLITEGVLRRQAPNHPSQDRPDILDKAPARSECKTFPDLTTSGMRFASTYAASGAYGGDEPPYTTKTDFTGTLDYIFVSQARGDGEGKEGAQGGSAAAAAAAGAAAASSRHFSVKDVLLIPEPGSEDDPEGMPDACWPSDHFTLAAVLEIPE